MLGGKCTSDKQRSVGLMLPRYKKHVVEIRMLGSINPLNTFRRVQKHWRKKTPKERWILIYNFGGKMTETLVGVRIFSDMRVYWFSYSAGTLMMIHFASMINTLWVAHKRNDILSGLQCTGTLGMCISVSCFFQIMSKFS